MARRLVPLLGLALLAAACGVAYEDAGTTTTTTTLAPPGVIPTGPADVVFSDQKTEGTSVIIDSVTMPAPGFVVLRIDESGAPGEVVGIGDVLVRGVIAEVEIPLFIALTEDTTIHAALHVDMDEDGVFTYEPPDDVIDVPATSANGEDATATALIELLPPLGPAEIEFDDQRSDGDSVVVASATLPAPGFISIWTSDEGEPGVLIGRSGLLGDVASESITIDLAPPVLETAPLIAAVHVDRDSNGVFVPGDSFDPLAVDLDGLPAFTTAFITVVRIGPVSVAVDGEQVDDEGDSIDIGPITMPGPGFLVLSIDGTVVATSDLLPPGETGSQTLSIDPLEPGDYDVRIVAFIDFDGDEALTDLDPRGLGEDGGGFEVGVVLTVPEPPDEDA